MRIGVVFACVHFASLAVPRLHLQVIMESKNSDCIKDILRTSTLQSYFLKKVSETKKPLQTSPKTFPRMPSTPPKRPWGVFKRFSSISLSYSGAPKPSQRVAQEVRGKTCWRIANLIILILTFNNSGMFCVASPLWNMQKTILGGSGWFRHGCRNHL